MSYEKYDQGIVEEALVFMAFGLPPGGCTMRMILNDITGARARMHPHSVPHIDRTFREVREIVRGIQITSRDDVDDWMKNGGIVGADASVAIQIKLTSEGTYQNIMAFVDKYRKQ